MSKVVLDVSMSLDGFIEGLNDEIEGGPTSPTSGRSWPFGLAMWRLAIHAMTRKLID